MDTKTKEKMPSTTAHKVFNILGIALCVILVPILIVNCVLLVKGFTDPDNVPTIGGVAPMIVLTDSMRGTFDGGDLVFIKTAQPEDIKANDIISYFDPEGSGTAVITHRVLEVINEDGKLSFQTKGDGNLSKDNVPIPAEKLIGTYTGVRIPKAGHVAMFMQTTWGMIICVLLPIVLLVGYDAIRRARYNKKHGVDKDKLLAELEELRALKAAQATASADAPADVPADAPAEQAPAEAPADTPAEE